MATADLVIAGKRLPARLLLGTARYPSPAVLAHCVRAAEPAMLTVSLRRTGPGGADFYHLLRNTGCPLLPNTAGCRTAVEAVRCASMARQLLSTNWLKLEVIGDDESMHPDPFELLVAAKELIAKGFDVLAYATEDLVLCRRLHELGCAAVMPWAAPIGSGQGIRHPERLVMLRERLPDAVLIVDAGIGRPSDAAMAMELGMDAVLLNTAIATATDPPAMATAFAAAVRAGRAAHLAGIMPITEFAQTSTPLTNIPFWQAEKAWLNR